MFVTLNVIIVSVIFVIIDLIPLYRKEEWVSFFMYGTILAFAIVIAVLMDLRIDVPSPSEPIKSIVMFFLGPVGQ